ncbi:MAG: T9SS type A sorting domain-containing protein [Luteibaculaceae bacterium]
MKHFLLFATTFFTVQAFAQGLTGTLTVGGDSPDYETFGAAIADLNVEGVGEGGVVFSVAPGVYNENLAITAISGASETNRVIFEASDRSDFPIIRGSGTTGFADAVIRLTGVSFITFDGFRIEDGGTSAANEIEFGLVMTGLSDAGCQFNEFKNLDIFMGVPNFPTSQRTRGIASTSAATADTPQFGNHNNLFEDIIINNVSSGINLRGSAALLSGLIVMADTNNVIRNSTFGNVRRIGHETNFAGASAIGLQAQKNVLIENCTIDSVKVAGSAALPVTVNGIRIDTGSGIIQNNSINFIESRGNQETQGNGTGTPTGITVATITGDEFLIANNTITNLSRFNFTASTTDPSISLAGIRAFQQTATGGGLTRIINNTIYLDTEQPVPFRSAGIQNVGSTSDVNLVQVFNNVVVNNMSTTSAAYRAVALADGKTPRTFFTSNHNVLQADGVNGFLGGIGLGLGGSNQVASTIEEWQTISGGGANSVEADVVFINAAAGDLRIDEELVSNIMDFGVPFNALVPFDFFGEARNESITGAGAFEINGLTVGISNPFAADNTFKAYPNPFNSTLTLEMDLNTSSFTNFRIIDITGKTVYEEAAGSLPNGFYRKILNLDNLNSGIYIVQIMGTQGSPVQTMKVIKN